MSQRVEPTIVGPKPTDDPPAVAMGDLQNLPKGLSAQMALHWVALSSAAFTAPDTTAILVDRCLDMGANPLHLDVIDEIRAQENMPVPVQLMGSSIAIKIHAVAPLGNAILQRNTQAVVMLTEALSKIVDIDASAPLLQGERVGVPVSLDAWKLCGHVGLEMPLQPLIEAFASRESFRAGGYLGAALEHALIERRNILYQPIATSKDSRHLARIFLAFGAEPSHETLTSNKIDPAWLVGAVSETSDGASLKALKLLIKAGFPVEAENPNVDPPMHLAAAANNPAAILELLDGGASLATRDKSGRTVIGLLQEQKNSEVVELLRVWLARKFALDAAGAFDAFDNGHKPRKAKK